MTVEKEVADVLAQVTKALETKPRFDAGSLVIGVGLVFIAFVLYSMAQRGPRGGGGGVGLVSDTPMPTPQRGPVAVATTERAA